MELTAFDELALWFKDNVFDEPIVSSEERAAQMAAIKAAEQDEAEDQQAAGGLSESARLYHWCPRRKRLVQST